MCVFQKSKEEILNEQAIRDAQNKTSKGSVTTSSYLGPTSSHAAPNGFGNNAIYADSHAESGSGGGGPLTMKDLKFSAKLNELKDLMQKKGHEAAEKLEADHGSVEQLARKLNTNLTNGISEDPAEISKRIGLYGRNEIPPKKPKSIFRLAFEALQDTTLVMLVICSIVSIGLSFYHPGDEAVVHDEEFRFSSNAAKSQTADSLEWVEGVAILIAVVVVVFVTAFNDWRKEKQFRGLKDRIDADNLASVIRNGVIKQVNVKELVVGDLCLIKYGDLVPADGIVVHASDLKVDESSLTGETDLIRKNTTDSITLLSGTHIMEGSGHFLILAVGVHSQSGIIMTLLGATEIEEIEPDPEELVAAAAAADKKKSNKKKENSYQATNGDTNKITPDKSTSSAVDDDDIKKKKAKANKRHRSVLQIKLGKLALQIGYGGMIAALFTFLILIARMAIEEFLILKHPWSNVYIKYIISYLIQAITVIVVAVPEGLPLAVTLALAFAVRKMTKDNNLVRHLDACETMGNATTICSDKTGTLTTNRMTAVQCWISGILYKTISNANQISNKTKQLIFESISVNSNYASKIEKPTQLGEIPKQIGNKTECGLLGFVNDLGGNYLQVRQDNPNETFVKCYTFNSARKMMSTVIRLDGGGYRVHSKGASEIVLSKCSHYLDASGKPVRITPDDCASLVSTVVEQMASEGLRTICVAYKDYLPRSAAANSASSNNVAFFDEEPDWEDESEVIANMTCLCLVGIEDPVRPEVPDAIRKCQKSGVVVRMVTGDNVNTATSIAMKCGIIRPQDNFLILESKEFNRRIRDGKGEVKQELLDKVWPRLRVLARSSPQDKYILVNGIVESKLSMNREVVAVTGDGTNDGPALKRADVGFAMGIQGTDVAKEASDIILTDDNFSSIVKAMMWGRNVYDAIAKFLQFQLTANLVAGIFSVVCAGTIQVVPLKAVQMLWVNLVMDTLASLALATEPPTEALLERKPYGRDKSILSFTMIRNIVFHAIYQLVILFLLIWEIEDWMQVESVLDTYDITKLKEPSLHFTIIFNAFVLMTLFNEINARKIHNERNVLTGIQKNKIFLGIWIGCFIGQILIVNFGGIVFGVERIGLDHWMWCLCLGFGSLIWGQIVTSIPVSLVKSIYRRMCCKPKPKPPKKVPLPVEEQFQEDLDDDMEAIERSKVLWIRGANRIQNQIRVVEAFRASAGDILETCSAYGSMASLKIPRNSSQQFQSNA